MRRMFLPLCVFLASTPVAAADVEALKLDLQLRIDGELVSQPTIITPSGQKASIESVSEHGRGVFIEVTPILQDAGQVHMAFSVASVKQGKKTLLSEPRIVTLLGREARIMQESAEQATKSMSLTVTPSLADR